MMELFAKQSIEICATASRVWCVLTEPEFTRCWIDAFGGLDGTIVSDWALGSPVQWTTADDKVIVEGNVTAVEPGRLLRFTVFDVRSERPPVSETDGITYTLSGQDGHTLLSVSQGDFAAMRDAEKYHQATVEVWKQVLPKIKSQAEA